MAGTGLAWHAESRRLKERDLLFTAEQYRRAIGQYYERNPGKRTFPRSQADFEGLEKYSDWRFVYVPQETVAGVPAGKG